MLGLVVMMLIALSSMVIIAQSGMLMTHEQNNFNLSQKESTQIETYRDILIMNALPVGDNGEFVLPLGTDTVNYHTFPSWLFTKTANTKGFDVIYCPYGPITTGTLSDSIKLTDSTVYDTRLVSNFLTNKNGSNQDYVVSSDAPPLGFDVLGFIISYYNLDNGIPSCADIIYNETVEAHTVSNGRVWSITDADIERYRTLSNINNTNSSFKNNVEGDTSSVGNTLFDNLEIIRDSNKYEAEINLPAGTHTVDDISLGVLAETKKYILITGNSDSFDSIVDYTDNNIDVLTFNNVKVRFKDIDFGTKGKFVFNNSDVEFDNIKIPHVVLNNSELDVYGETTFQGERREPIFEVYDSKVNLKSASDVTFSDSIVNATMLIKSTNSDLVFESSNVELSGNVDHIKLYSGSMKSFSSVIEINNNPSVSLDGYADSLIIFNDSTINVNNAPSIIVDTRGKVYLESSGVITKASNTAKVFNLRGGSELGIENATIIGSLNSSFRPSYGIFDIGAKNIFGNSSTIYSAAKCWIGDIFTSSDAQPSDIGEDNSTSETIDVYFRMWNRSNWDCVK